MKIIKEKLLHLFQKEPRTFSPQVKPRFVKMSTVSGDLRDLGYCVDPPKDSFRQSRPFRCRSRLGMRGAIIRRKSQQFNHQGKI